MMKDLDLSADYETSHDADYDQLLEHIVGDDHELLRLDALLHEVLGKDSLSE
jgi:hypothetical protein